MIGWQAIDESERPGRGVVPSDTLGPPSGLVRETLGLDQI